MFLKLNIVDNGGCAHLYAHAEKYESAFILNNEPVRHIQIWHNDGWPSLTKNKYHSVNCINDLFLWFKSKVSFAWFCEQFSQSEYNKHENYHVLTHNCANAAHYALSLARIHLPISSFRCNRFSYYSCLHIPGFILTPTRLFEVALEFKCKQQNQHMRGNNPVTHLHQRAQTFFSNTYSA